MIRWLRRTFGFGSDADEGLTRAQAMSLVQRSRAGDQNAMALIAGTYQAAAKGGNTKAEAALELILEVIRRNPAPQGAVFAGTVSLPDPGPVLSVAPVQPKMPPATAALSVPNELTPKQETAAHLGVLKWAARGSSDDQTDLWCLRLCGQALLYCATSGDPSAIPIAIVILAHGAPLSSTRIVSLIEQAPEELRAPLDHSITHSAAYPDPYELAGPGSAPTVDAVREAGRALGQARRLQTLRLPGAPLALYSPVMGAEVDGVSVVTQLVATHSELRNAS